MTKPYGDWLVCERTRSALARLDKTLESAITAEDLQLRLMVLDLIGRGGKRLRPALLFLSATFGRFEGDRLQLAAAAMELYHVASLYHDDVMDRAPQRRKGASINHRWGNMAAAFAGTYLFARGSMLLATLGNTANQIASQASLELCSGQLQEVENAFNLDLSEEEHLQIISRKTGTLFETPSRLGAYLSRATTIHAQALANYGRHLGIAFQLADDALDLVGDPAETGKATGTDLREGVYSLPVLRSLQNDSGTGPALKAVLSKAYLEETDVQKALQLVRSGGTVAEVIGLAEHYRDKAQATLDGLPDGQARRSLLNLADFAVQRRA